LDDLKTRIGGRPVWLAASTHDGEEEAVAAAHRALRERFPDLLTLLAPRHPARAEQVAALLQDFRLARRSAGALPTPETEIYLIDTLGELGLFYRLAPIVLVAGSLGAPGSVGGHNPLEAAQLGCAVIFGSDTVNCAASAAALEHAGAALRLGDLTETLGRLLADPAAAARMGAAGLAVAETHRGVIDRVLQRLEPLVAPLAGPDHAGA